MAKYTVSKSGILTVELSLTPADLIALEKGTYVGDPIRNAVEAAAEESGRNVRWDSHRTWTNKQPQHNGIDIRVSFRTTKKEPDNDERADD